MGQGALRDRFANIASIGVTMSGANTLTFASINTNMGFLGRRDQALAMIIDEIQYSPDSGPINEMTAATDVVEMGLTTSSLVTSLPDLTDQRVLDFHKWLRADYGTAASAQILEFPARKQFFPPLITAERTIFLGMRTVGLASAGGGNLRILFRVETLTAGELVELSEVFRLTG